MAFDDTWLIIPGFLAVPYYMKQILIAGVLGLAMGFERAIRMKAASLRTFAIISVGSCVFALLSITAAGSSQQSMPYDVTRVAAGIVTGVGFVGGGVIFKTSDRIEGITTGVMIWLAAALGMACGFNEIALAIWSFIAYCLVLILSWFVYHFVDLLHMYVFHTHPDKMRYPPKSYVEKHSK